MFSPGAGVADLDPALVGEPAVVVVAARSEGTASALLTATRQCGSALGVAIVSAALVAVHGPTYHRTAVAVFITAGFALLVLLATRVVPPASPHPPTPPHPPAPRPSTALPAPQLPAPQLSAPRSQPEPHHLFRYQAGGIP